jgi:Rha family phage regulatory protein
MSELKVQAAAPAALVFEKNDKPMTDSLKVAEYFGKEHKHVLRDIEEKVLPHADKDFTETNFGLSSYKDSTGKRNKMYLLTKNGFSLLAMGFTGNKAMDFKVKYINAFDHMADFIRQIDTARFEFHDFAEAIKQAHVDDLHSYHFSNELDLINRIVLGVSTRQFRKANGITGDSIRPHLSAAQLDGIIKLQRFDMGLVVTMPKYDDRKRILTDYYQRITAAKALPA